MNRPKAPPDKFKGSAPDARILSIVAGSDKALVNAFRSLSSTVAEVPFGASTPSQAEAFIEGIKVSEIVGTCGSEGIRLALITANARILPL